MNKQENIPALRFPEFTGNWVARKLRELTDLITKGTTPKKFVSEGIKFIKIECFEEDRINANKCLFVEEYTHNKELKRSILQEGDLLFAIAGATIGKVNFVTKDILPANTNQALAIIRLKQSENRDYIYQVLRSKRMQKYILDSISVGAQPNLNLEQMGNFSFYYPTLPEQQKIATFLSSVDEKLQGLKKKKNLLEAYKKGMMQRLFSQTLRFKDENGEDFPEWEEKTLGEVATNKSRKYNPEQETESVKCIELEHLASGTSQLLGYIDGKNSGSIKNRFNSGDILFGKLRPYLRKYLHAPFDGVCSSEIWVLSGKNISNDFLFRLVQTEFFIDLANQSSGSKMPRADWNVIENGLFLLPTLPEQTKIANFLSAIDEKIAKVSQEIEQATVWKKGLLQQMFV